MRVESARPTLPSRVESVIVWLIEEMSRALPTDEQTFKTSAFTQTHSPNRNRTTVASYNAAIIASPENHVQSQDDACV